VPCTCTHSHFGVFCGSATAPSQRFRRRTSLCRAYRLLFMSSIVLTVSQPVHFPIRPGTYHGRRHSAAVFPPLVLCAHNLCFFDVGSFCAASAFFARLRRLPARFWSYQNTCRSSPTCWAMRGIIFIHFAGVAPFSTAVVTASRCLASCARLALRKKTFQDCVPL